MGGDDVDSDGDGFTNEEGGGTTTPCSGGDTGGDCEDNCVYIANPGSAILVGNSGLGAIPGLAFDPADGKCYGTYTAAVLSDAEIARLGDNSIRTVGLVVMIIGVVTLFVVRA